MIKICASLLAGDFLHVGDDILRMRDAGADMLHLDVMDGHYVPNISFGFPIIEAAAKLSALPCDVHLMIEQPERYIEAFARAGADMISVHAESTKHLHRALTQIRACGLKAGVALNPATSIDCLQYVLGEFDFALIMTVNPGFGGQSLIPQALQKISDVRDLLRATNTIAEIQVDGGVAQDTAAEVIRRGATMLVTGSALFKSKDPARMIRDIKALDGAKAL